MSEFLTYHFTNCLVRYFPSADYLETVFQDGAKCPAQFSFTHVDARKAVELGYTSKVNVGRHGLCGPIRQMHLEHELSHTFLAEALGEPYCPVLRSVAVKGPCTFAWERESLVLDWQKYLNGKEASAHLIIALKGPGGVIGEMVDFLRRFRK